MRRGVLDSISIVPNTGAFDECMKMLLDAIEELPFLPLMSVHLNFVEGIRLSPGKDKGRPIETGWGELWLASYNPFKKKGVRNEIKKELTAQVNKAWRAVNDCILKAREKGIPCGQKELRIDSHQHTHHIPVVMEALFESIEENGWNTEYIRNSKEPLLPFFSDRSLIKSYRAVNIIKNLILNLYSGRLDRYNRRYNRRPMYLWGLVMSGRMDRKRTERLLPAMYKKAKESGRDLEILFHPGRMEKSEYNEEIDQKAARSFYLSDDRNAEYNAALRMRELKISLEA